MPDFREVLRQCFGSDSENNFTPTTEHEEVEQTTEHYEISTTAEEVEESPDTTQPQPGRDVKEGPKVDQVYPDIDTLFRFYQEHAKLRGFAVVIRSRSKRRDGYYAVIQCDRGGTPDNNKRTKKTDCKAHINAREEPDGSWKVVLVKEAHNGHELTPGMSYLMRGHRGISAAMKRQLMTNDMAGIRVCKNIRLAEVQCGGPEYLGFTPKDARNYIEYERSQQILKGDANAMMNIFEQLKEESGNAFYYSVDLDADGSLANVMWVDPRSRAAYEEFHDVISFDTTYLVNKYEMPFGSFVGINHHGQSILLGCALLGNEKAETLRWLFRRWLQAMGNVRPKCIITDQCESIGTAIKELMPDTVHRFCLWHITQKLPDKFKGPGSREILSVLRRLIYESIDPGTFEHKFNEFVTNYELQDHSWVQTMYDKRKQWIPCFLSHQFWGGMLSTQRSEGMHAYFDGFINRMSSLTMFIQQYQAAVKSKVEKEKHEDLASKTVAQNLLTEYSWEAQFRSAYTKRVFKKFQRQVQRMIRCDVGSQLFDPETGVETIKVREDNPEDMLNVAEFYFTVQWRSEGEHLSCNCRKFEFEGILCCHILKVMANKSIKLANERYILRRWRKDVVRRHSSIAYKVSYPHMTPIDKIHRICQNLLEDAASFCFDSYSKMDYLKQTMEEVNATVRQLAPGAGTANAGASASRTTPGADDNSVGNAGIKNPKTTKRRGRPRLNCYKPSSGAKKSGKTTKGGTKSGRGVSAASDTLREEPRPTLCARRYVNLDLNGTVGGGPREFPFL